MKIEIQIDRELRRAEDRRYDTQVSEEISEILKKLSEDPSEMLAGFRDERASILEPNQIYRVFASGGKVYAEADGGPYLLRMRLYEAEQRLAGRSFVRISNGEIVNLKKVRGFV